MDANKPRHEDIKKLVIALIALLFIAGGILVFLALPSSPTGTGLQNAEESAFVEQESARLPPAQSQEEQEQLDQLHQQSPAEDESAN